MSLASIGSEVPKSWTGKDSAYHLQGISHQTIPFCKCPMLEDNKTLVGFGARF